MSVRVDDEEKCYTPSLNSARDFNYLIPKDAKLTKILNITIKDDMNFQKFESVLKNRVKRKGPIYKKILKDLNLIEFNMYLKSKNTQVIRLTPEDEIKIEKIMLEDAKLLKFMGLMDYSLLLCIERVQQTNEKIQEA